MALPDVSVGDPHVNAHNSERSVLNSIQDFTDPVLRTAVLAAIASETNAIEARPLAKWKAGVANRHIKPARIVNLGDSFTWGLTATTFQYRFADLVTARLQAAHPSGIPGYEHNPGLLSDTPSILPGVQSYNGGFGGATTATYASSAHLYGVGLIQPSLVIHQIGFNDMRVDNRSAEDYGIGLAAAVDAVAGVVPNASQILIHTSRPYDKTVAAWDAYGVELKKVASTRPDVLAVDMSQHFERANHANGDPFKLIADTIHPTDAGHMFIAELLLAAMRVSPPSMDNRLHLVDTFTRPNSATLGSVEKPSNVVWSNLAGTFGVQSNRAVATATNSIAAAETGLSNLDVSLVARIQDGNPFPGMLFRLVNVNTWLGLFLNQASGQITLFRNNGGALTALSSPALSIQDGEHHLRAVAQGARLDLYHRGAIKIQHSLTEADMTTFGSATKIGLWENSGVTAAPGSGFWGLAVRRV